MTLYFKPHPLIIATIACGLLAGCATKQPPYFATSAEFYADTGVVHTVVLGDTIDKIAESHGVGVDYIVNANALPINYRLYVGQTLKIPNVYLHRVKRGETLPEIARLYGVSWLDLAGRNELEMSADLVIGSVLKIPARRVNRPVGNKPVTVGDLLDTIISQGGNIVALPPSGTSKNMTNSGVGNPPVVKTAPIATPTPITPPKQDVPKGFIWPVEGDVVRQFGKTYDGIKNDGISISAPAGTSVSSAEDGEIAYIGNSIQGMGNMILVRHSNGYITVYAHLEETLVAKGDRVTKGDIIGTVGQTGKPDTPQLHFEIRQGKTALNPTTVFGA